MPSAPFPLPGPKLDGTAITCPQCGTVNRVSYTEAVVGVPCSNCGNIIKASAGKPYPVEPPIKKKEDDPQNESKNN